MFPAITVVTHSPTFHSAPFLTHTDATFILHSPVLVMHLPLVSPSLTTLSLPTRHSHPVEHHSVTTTLLPDRSCLITLSFTPVSHNLWSPLSPSRLPVSCHSVTHHCNLLLTTMSLSHSLLSDTRILAQILEIFWTWRRKGLFLST